MRIHAITKNLSNTKSKTNIWSLRILLESLSSKNLGFLMKRVPNISRMIFSLSKIKHRSMLQGDNSLIHITASVNMKLSKNLVKEGLGKFFWLITSILEKNVQLRSLRSVQPLISTQFL